MTHTQKFCVSIFLSTLSLRRATFSAGTKYDTTKNFYPRSPCGERLTISIVLFMPPIFLSTLSLRRATSSTLIIGFSAGVFLSTLSLRRATPVRDVIQWEGIFLSTLSLRRATPPFVTLFNGKVYFYPRSPCGERLLSRQVFRFAFPISIHALLAESDLIIMLYDTSSIIFLSTLSLRRATLNYDGR